MNPSNSSFSFTSGNTGQTQPTIGGFGSAQPQQQQQSIGGFGGTSNIFSLNQPQQQQQNSIFGSLTGQPQQQQQQQPQQQQTQVQAAPPTTLQGRQSKIC